jgi:hypothetical protein
MLPPERVFFVMLFPHFLRWGGPDPPGTLSDLFPEDTERDLSDFDLDDPAPGPKEENAAGRGTPVDRAEKIPASGMRFMGGTTAITP